MDYIEEQVVDSLRVLPLEKQQEVLDFVKSLKLRLAVKDAQAKNTDDSVQPKPSNFYEEFVSQYAGCVDSGYTDLSTNKAHMEGFGKV